MMIDGIRVLKPFHVAVLAGAHRQGGKDLRREWSTPRLHHHAYDWLPERVCQTLPCWYVESFFFFESIVVSFFFLIHNSQR